MPEHDVTIMRGFRRRWRGKDRQAGEWTKTLFLLQNRNRLKLGSLRPRRRRAKLVVVGPAHFTLLARSQITGAQTIPIKLDTL
jgi:hypothetical protein